MKILVPIKRVIDPYAKVRPLGDGTGIDTTGVKFDVNPFDEIAVEEAVRLKEKDSSIEVVVVSLGGPEVEEQLRKALAIGADRAILVEVSSEMDPGTVSRELESLARTEGVDLILMGKQGTDGDNNQVGQRLAARLGWPQATFAAQIERDGAALKVTRETDSGEEVLSLPLPAVVTTDLRLNEPRYIALPGIIKARSKPLDKRSASGGGSVQVRTIAVESAPARPAGRKVASVDELVAALKERGVVGA